MQDRGHVLRSAGVFQEFFPERLCPSLYKLPGDTVASRTLVRSIFLEDGGCFQALPDLNRHHERTRRKFEMENDLGRFRAVVIGVVLISIASIPPLVIIQTEGTGKDIHTSNKMR